MEILEIVDCLHIWWIIKLCFLPDNSINNNKMTKYVESKKHFIKQNSIAMAYNYYHSNDQWCHNCSSNFSFILYNISKSGEICFFFVLILIFNFQKKYWQERKLLRIKKRISIIFLCCFHILVFILSFLGFYFSTVQASFLKIFSWDRKIIVLYLGMFYCKWFEDISKKTLVRK